MQLGESIFFFTKPLNDFFISYLNSISIFINKFSFNYSKTEIVEILLQRSKEYDLISVLYKSFN